MTTVIAVVAALTAAFCFAQASLVQQTVARASGADEVLRLRLLLDLARRPLWLAGIGLDALSFFILAVALGFGPLALVQPLASLDVLFVLPLIARRQHRRLTLGDGIGAAAVAAGIAVFLVIATPSGGTAVPGLTAWAPVFVGAALLSGLAALAGLRVQGKARVIWFAVAAGAMYGVLDSLAKATVDVVAHRGLGVMATWEPWALLAAGITGALLGQSAFSSGALVAQPAGDRHAVPDHRGDHRGHRVRRAPGQLGLAARGAARRRRAGRDRHLPAQPVLDRGRGNHGATAGAGAGRGGRSGAKRDRLRKLIGGRGKIGP